MMVAHICSQQLEHPLHHGSQRSQLSHGALGINIRLHPHSSLKSDQSNNALCHKNNLPLKVQIKAWDYHRGQTDTIQV